MSLKDDSQFGQATPKTHPPILYALHRLRFHAHYGDCRRHLAGVAHGYYHRPDPGSERDFVRVRPLSCIWESGCPSRVGTVGATLG